MTFWAAVKLILTLHCEESSRLMSEGLERKLSLSERWAVRLHFISCKACRRFRRQLEFIQEAARRQADRHASAKLSPQSHQRIAERLRNEGSDPSEI